MAIVEFEKVEKRYGALVALSDVSLSLEGGRIGLLGPNGAGKSTLLKTILGLVQYDHGSVRVFDKEVARDPFGTRSQIGYMPEGDSILPGMTALSYTAFAAELCGLPRSEATGRAHQVLHYVGLGEARYRSLSSFSTGMKQRARLAQALVGDPKLILLDEPTSGLDPRGRDEMLQLILDIPRRTGASIILSTHILPDVEKTCDQVVLLAGGKVRYAGDLEPLVRPDANTFEVRVKGDHKKLKSPLELAQCRVRVEGDLMDVRVPEGKNANHILSVAVDSGVQIRHIAPFVQTLERAFMKKLEETGDTAPEG